jgi:hypothetical protein
MDVNPLLEDPMHRLRTAAVAALAVCALTLGAASTASAAQQPTTSLTKKVAVTGTKAFKGTYTIDRFTARSGKLVAVGTLKGTLRRAGKTRSVSRKNVVMPAAATGAGPLTGAKASQLPPLPNSCQILNLVLGPINLNLLGLVVRTNQINVRIDAVRGPGNLLGNLLCAITGILNPTGALGQLTTAIDNLTAALNAILALIPTNPATAASAAAAG